jgi:hypothetical protein
MIAQGAMAFNSLCLPSGDPYGVPQIVVTLKSFSQELVRCQTWFSGLCRT